MSFQRVLVDGLFPVNVGSHAREHEVTIQFRARWLPACPPPLWVRNLTPQQSSNPSSHKASKAGLRVHSWERKHGKGCPRLWSCTQLSLSSAGTGCPVMTRGCSPPLHSQRALCPSPGPGQPATGRPGAPCPHGHRAAPLCPPDSGTCQLGLSRAVVSRLYPLQA